MTFLKKDPTPCATLNQVFLDRFELVVAHFGPPKIPKCLENGLFWDQKWGAQTGEMRAFGADCGAFWPLGSPKSLESGPRGDGVHLRSDSTLSRAINV